MLLEADILTQILEADGKLGEAESNLLLEAMEFTGLVVPSSLSGAQFMLDELSQNLVQEMHIKQYLSWLLQDTQTLKNILIFLCSIPPETNLRLVLQLALAAYIPDDKLQVLFSQLQSARSLESLLLEAMEFTGLIVPTSLSGAQFLLKELSQNLVNEMHIKALIG